MAFAIRPHVQISELELTEGAQIVHSRRVAEGPMGGNAHYTGDPTESSVRIVLTATAVRTTALTTRRLLKIVFAAATVCSAALSASCDMRVVVWSTQSVG